MVKDKRAHIEALAHADVEAQAGRVHRSTTSHARDEAIYQAWTDGAFRSFAELGRYMHPSITGERVKQIVRRVEREHDEGQQAGDEHEPTS